MTSTRIYITDRAIASRGIRSSGYIAVPHKCRLVPVIATCQRIVYPYVEESSIDFIFSKGKDIEIIDLNGGVRLDRKSVYELVRIHVGDLLSKIPTDSDIELKEETRPYVFIMDESQHILGCGARAVTKLCVPQKSGQRIRRIFNFKYPFEYISRHEEILERKEQVGKLS